MKHPMLHCFHARHPELAGLWMRRQVRAGLLVKYRHSARHGFFIVAVWPRWRWLARLVLWAWPRQRTLQGFADIVALLVALLFLLSLGGGR